MFDSRQEAVGKIVVGGTTTGKTIGIGNGWTESSKRWEVDIVTACMIGEIIVPAAKDGAISDACKGRDGLGKVLI